MILFLLLGCLERSTGEAVPLDPRFYADVEASQADPNGPGEGADPFADHEGPKVVVQGEITSEVAGAIDLDLRVPDAKEEGGMRSLGKILLDAPGSFSFGVPSGLGPLFIQAFVDQDSDGPDEQDPYAEIELDIGDVAPEPQNWTLVVGARSASPGGVANQVPHKDVPHGQGTGRATPFSDHEGPWVTIKGVIGADEDGAVHVDLGSPDVGAEGGRRLHGKLMLEGTGPFSFKVPRGVGPLILQIFQDPGQDGPDEFDPFAEVRLEVGQADPEPVRWTLTPGGRSPDAMSSSASAQPGQPAADEGPTLRLSGTLTVEGMELGPDQEVDLDVFIKDAAEVEGRRLHSKHKLHLGKWSIKIPQELGAVELEAFVDLAGDGPGQGDPMGLCKQNPLAIGTDDLGQQELRLVPR
jgi:hypothetical protein